VKDRDDELFSGDYWTGEEAVTLGLADDLCDLPTLLQDEFHVKAIKDYTLPASIFTGLATSFGASMKDHLSFETKGPQFLPY
jgi:protease-4